MKFMMVPMMNIMMKKMRNIFTRNWRTCLVRTSTRSSVQDRLEFYKF